MLPKASLPLRSNVFAAFAVFATLLISTAAGGQAIDTAVRAVPNRLVKPIDENSRVTMSGTMHRLASKQNDRGAAADGLKLDRLQIMLRRSDAQEAELKQLIGDLHRPGNPNYQKWLTPEDFGKRFGPSDADVAKLESWLQSHGFSILKLNPGRQTLEIAGTAGQFRDTFKAQLHSYQIKGQSGQAETHYANAVDPQIPTALSPVFGGFASLNNFRLKSYSRRLGTASYNTVTHETKPDWTIGSSTDFNLVLAPQDFAVQYDLPNQATAGTNDGTGQSIAVVNESNINIYLVNQYRKLFGLPPNPPQIIIDGNDPGIDGINNPDGENFASGEAYLDVEESGAVAPGATINFVIAADTALENGLAFAAERAVYSNLSPVISLSFGECEQGLGSGNSFWSGLWEQAAAQGITVAVSTGDNGSAACDDPNSQPYALFGQAVSGLASTPYNVAVGGTDFYYTNYATGTPASGALNTELGTYWNLATSTQNNQTPVVSLKKPVPEQPWNDSQYGLDISSYFTNTGSTTIAAGSGGASTQGLEASNGTFGPYPKPVWQTGTGVPSDSVRDVPDVSLFASNGSNLTYYPICASDADCQPATGTNLVQFSGVGGTSASTPAFAGVMALVNQQYGRQGQATFKLYPLAAQFPAAFHDVTVGSNSVPCNTEEAENLNSGTFYAASTDCLAVTPTITAGNGNFSDSTEGEIGLSSTAAYNATAGYDPASGLGTLDVAVLLADWNKVSFGTTAVSLTPSQTTFAHGTAITVSGAVTGSPTPTGDVALITDSTEVLNPPSSYNFFTLANGSYTGNVNYLPGGTYNIWGNYGGDASNAGSSSVANKVQITVTPEASTTALSVYTGSNGSYGAVGAGGSYAYGTPMLVGAQAKPSAGSITTNPTGSVVFTDGSTTIDTAVVNAEGDAEFYNAFAPGSHTVKAAYSGDPSYGASTSSTQTFTIVADTPTFIGPTYTNSGSSGLLPGQQAIIVGVANGDASNNPALSSNAVAPAGTMTLTGAPSGTTTSATLIPAVDPFYGAIQGIATFIVPAGASGTYNLTFTYTPSNPTYYTGITGTAQGVPFLAAASGLVASTTAAVATPTAASPASLVDVTSTITGQSGKPAPTGSITIFTSDVAFGTFTLPAGIGTKTTITILFDSAGLIQGTNPLTVQYSGDSNYLPSSAQVTVNNPLSDFQMVPLTTVISVPVGANSAADTIELTSTNGFAGAVTLSCTGAGGIICSTNPASATLTSGVQTSTLLTVNTAAVSAVGTYNVVVTGTDATGHFVHTLGFQVVVPQVAAPIPGITVSAAPATVTIASQGASGTSTVSVTPTNSFIGSVALTCAITASPAGAIDTPTCAFATPTVNITDTTAQSDVLTISTTAPTTTASLALPKRMVFPGWSLAGGAALAALLFLGGPIGRRRKMALTSIRTMRILSAAMLFAVIASGGLGCGGSSSNGGGSTGTLTANAGGPYTGTAGTAIAFSGAASTVPTNQTITSYAWNFGDSSTGSGVTPTHAYTAAGTYTVTLTVTDTNGATATATATATVTAIPSGTTTGAYTVTVTATRATGTAQTTTIAVTVN